MIGALPAGLFPHEVSVGPSGILLVTNALSQQLEAVDTTTLP